MWTPWRPGAVIFDLDGVLVDSEPLHQRALDAVLADVGRRALRPDEHATFVGLDDRQIWGLLVERLRLSGTPETHIERFERVLAALIAGNVQPAPGAAELVASLTGAGVPIALASSSRRVVVDAMLEALGLVEAFAVTLAGDEIASGKPDPRIYREVAAALHVSPGACLVIEDSPPGIAAAKAAGMRVVAVRTRYTAGVPLEADVIVDSLSVLSGDGWARLDLGRRRAID